MLLPLLMAKLMPYMEKLREWWLMAGNKQYKREIQHTKRAGWYHSQVTSYEQNPTYPSVFGNILMPRWGVESTLHLDMVLLQQVLCLRPD